ncbi:uncharacterized protein SPAPADRAFT_63006, partial [Spathaspora passalidarum NRRL Y-27907]
MRLLIIYFISIISGTKLFERDDDCIEICTKAHALIKPCYDLAHDHIEFSKCICEDEKYRKALQECAQNCADDTDYESEQEDYEESCRDFMKNYSSL